MARSSQDLAREAPAMKSRKYGEYGSFEHFFFRVIIIITSAATASRSTTSTTNVASATASVITMCL